MKQLQTPNGSLIEGIFELVPGKCLIDGFEINADGSLEPEYSGSTDMFWDEQKEITQIEQDVGVSINYICEYYVPDRRIYLDGEGNEWRLDQLTVIDGENNENTY